MTTRIATAKGQLRHRFWGTYSAAIGLQFVNASDAQQALPLLGAGWRNSTNPVVLVWEGDTAALDACEGRLVGFGADAKAIRSLAHSVDYGDPFTVSIPIPDAPLFICLEV